LKRRRMPSGELGWITNVSLIWRDASRLNTSMPTGFFRRSSKPWGYGLNESNATGIGPVELSSSGQKFSLKSHCHFLSHKVACQKSGVLVAPNSLSSW